MPQVFGLGVGGLPVGIIMSLEFGALRLKLSVVMLRNMENSVFGVGILSVPA